MDWAALRHAFAVVGYDEAVADARTAGTVAGAVPLAIRGRPLDEATALTVPDHDRQ